MAGTPPTHDELFKQFGALAINMRALEYAIRMFLLLKETPGSLPAIGPFYKGLLVPENAFTNFDTLSKLVNNFNAKVGHENKALRLDRARLVELRDALAHGRIYIEQRTGLWHLVKLNRPKSKLVPVDFDVELTSEWLDEHTHLFEREHEKVKTAMASDPRAPRPTPIRYSPRRDPCEG